MRDYLCFLEVGFDLCFVVILLENCYMIFDFHAYNVDFYGCYSLFDEYFEDCFDGCICLHNDF